MDMNYIDIHPLNTDTLYRESAKKGIVCIPSEIVDKLTRAGLSKSFFLNYNKVRPLLTVNDLRTWFAVNDMAIFPNSSIKISEKMLIDHFDQFEPITRENRVELEREVFPPNSTALLTPYFNSYAFNSITYSVDIEAEIFVTPTGIMVSVPSGYFSYLAKVNSEKVAFVTKLIKTAHKLFSIEEVTKLSCFSLYVSYLRP